MGNGARLRCKGLAAECRQWSDAIGDVEVRSRKPR